MGVSMFSMSLMIMATGLLVLVVIVVVLVVIVVMLMMVVIMLAMIVAMLMMVVIMLAMIVVVLLVIMIMTFALRMRLFDFLLKTVPRTSFMREMLVRPCVLLRSWLMLMMRMRAIMMTSCMLVTVKDLHDVQVAQQPEYRRQQHIEWLLHD
jgi:hypothetical protein